MDLSHISILPPPRGVTSNFVNPTSQARAIKIITGICIFLSSLSFVMRLYSRLWIKRTFKIDDITCLLSLVGMIIYTAVLWSTLSVVGKHGWDVAVSEYTSGLIRSLIIGLEIGYGPIVFFAKLTLLILYFHIFAISRWVKYCINVGIATIFAVYAGCIIGYGVLCVPRIGEGWLEAVINPKCSQTALKFGYIQGVFGVISDFYLFCLPIPVILRLQLPLKKKIGVCFIFMTGFLACISSIVGLYFRIRIVKSPDVDWNLGIMEVVVVIELSVGIICSCLPLTTPIFRKHDLGFLSFAKIKIFGFKESILSIHNYFNRLNKRSAKEHHLETGILGSVYEDGRFMKTEDFPSTTT